jgi:hypothetical protein
VRLEFGETPAHEGVFGPEIWLNAVSGAACLRYDDGTTVGCPPEEPVTNAFVVWLARPVVVVSEGVDAVAVPAVAKELRALLEDPTVPVVFLLRRARAMSDGAGGLQRPRACPCRGVRTSAGGVRGARTDRGGARRPIVCLPARISDRREPRVPTAYRIENGQRDLARRGRCPRPRFVRACTSTSTRGRSSSPTSSPCRLRRHHECGGSRGAVSSARGARRSSPELSQGAQTPRGGGRRRRRQKMTLPGSDDGSASFTRYAMAMLRYSPVPSRRRPRRGGGVGKPGTGRRDASISASSRLDRTA